MPASDLLYASARTLARAIRAKQISPVELMDATLSRIDTENGKINAIIWRNDEEARIAARAATDAVVHADVSELPPFHGVPVPIKDLTTVAGWPVTYGSWATLGAPSTETELVVEALSRAGFILTGRTNVPEFGPITVAENERYGISRNPWNLDHTPGGSSGGAGAAVAAGMFSVAHGNDGGGSIRIPASCCGLVGLKVSRGRIPRLVNSWEGGSVEGVLTHDVADTAAILDVTCGPDRGQWYNAPSPERPFFDEVGIEPGPLRVGLVLEAPLGLPMDPECAQAARQAGFTLERLGHHVQRVELEVPDEFVEPFLNVVNAGLASYDADWNKAEPHIQANLAQARRVDSISYVRSAYQLQRFSRRLVARWGKEFDVMVTPTMTILPPRAGQILAAAHEGAESGSPVLQVIQMAVLNSEFNMSGQPAMSLPTHMSDQGLPVGVQVVAGPWEEALLLRVASQLEAALPWAGRLPPV
jgi:amidase